MLNHDVSKDIVFDIEKWTAVTGGDTGPYLMMQYTRVAGMERKVKTHPNAVVDFSLLDDAKSQEILLLVSFSFCVSEFGVCLWTISFFRLLCLNFFVAIEAFQVSYFRTLNSLFLIESNYFLSCLNNCLNKSAS